MSLVFPRDMTSSHCWEDQAFRLVSRQELSRTAGGEIQGKDLGPAVWVATFASYPLLQADAETLEVDLQTLDGVIHTFYAAPRRAAPAARDGEALTGVVVESISANNDALALRFLPAGFELRAGDYLSIETAVGGRELHRLHSGATADAQGITGEMVVVPHVRPGVATGDAVTLVSPTAEMRLRPDTLQSRRVTRRRWRVSFEAVQVIR